MAKLKSIGILVLVILLLVGLTVGAYAASSIMGAVNKVERPEIEIGKNWEIKGELRYGDKIPPPPRHRKPSDTIPTTDTIPNTDTVPATDTIPSTDTIPAIDKIPNTSEIHIPDPAQEKAWIESRPRPSDEAIRPVQVPNED